MPTYRVDRPGMDLPRMVEAAQPSAARKHVADSELTVRRIEIGEALALQKQGVEYETAGEEAPQGEPASEEAQQSQNQGEQQEEPPMTETDRLRHEGTDEELEGN